MNPAMKLMFDSIADAVLVIGRDGRVKFGNHTAASMMNAVPGEVVPAGMLERAVHDAVAGYITLPHTIEFTLGDNFADSDRLSAQLLPAPVGTDFVAVIRNLTQSAFYATVVDNFLALVRQELTQPLQGFVASLEPLMADLQRVAAADPKHVEAITSVERNGQLLGSKLGKLSELAAAFGGEPMVGEERLLLADLVSDAARRSLPVAVEQGVRLLVPEAESSLPAIYGSRRWLIRAIDEFLENALRNASRGSSVTLTLAKQDTFVRLAVTNAGRALTAGQGERAFVAFGKGPSSGADTSRAGARGLGIGLALARRIIELHGGNVAVHADGEFGSTFILELPTGAPKRDTTQLDIEQAKRYAADMSRLLKRRAAGKPGAAKAPAPAAATAAVSSPR